MLASIHRVNMMVIVKGLCVTVCSASRTSNCGIFGSDSQKYNRFIPNLVLPLSELFNLFIKIICVYRSTNSFMENTLLHLE